MRNLTGKQQHCQSCLAKGKRHKGVMQANQMLKCPECGAEWYAYHCWNCKTPIDSRFHTKRCPSCNWYQCPTCNQCGCGYQEMLARERAKAQA